MLDIDMNIISSQFPQGHSMVRNQFVIKSMKNDGSSLESTAASYASIHLHPLAPPAHCRASTGAVLRSRQEVEGRGS